MGQQQGITIPVLRATSSNVMQPDRQALGGSSRGANRSGSSGIVCESLQSHTFFRGMVALIALGLGLNNMYAGGRPWLPHTWRGESGWVFVDSRLGMPTKAHIISKLTEGRGMGGGLVKNSTLQIPRMIHQTYPTKEMPGNVLELMDTWVTSNPGWVVRFYDDAQCLDMVRKEFPEYLDAYQSLPKNVERADFFRYLVVLRYGGVYADVDTESIVSMESVIGPGDLLVVGWEAEFPSGTEAFERHFVRLRQVLQWVFAAAPGHPALREICERVAANAKKTMSGSSNRDTLERTGPGLFTDVILKHAGKREEGIRILPQVAFGVHPSGTDGLTPDSPGIVVFHHFLGSWKKKGGWHKGDFVERSLHRLMGKAPEEVPKLDGDPGLSLFPVTVPWHPSFVIMVHLRGHGEKFGSADAGAVISKWGNWQGSMDVTRRPSVADALVGSLGLDANLVLLDIAAGLGFFSLAAAASGHHVLAFETLPKNIDAFTASVEYNKFGNLVEFHKVDLGALVPGLQCQTMSKENQDLNLDTRIGEHAPIEEEKYSARGVSDNSVNDTSTLESSGSGCVRRVLLAEYAPKDARIGAIRIGANGNAGWLIEEGEDVIAWHMPNVIVVEFAPKLMRKSGYPDPVRLIWTLYNLGYQEVFHAGRICDVRWLKITQKMRHRGFFSEEQKPQLKQPTWCRLKSGGFKDLAADIPEDMPENLLFVHRDSAD